MAAFSTLASEQLTREQLYTRAELKEVFSLSDATIDRGVFRPSGYSSVWLFVTAHQASGKYITQLLDADTLLWAGQPAGRTDQLIITHEQLGLELLIFFRESAAQHPNAAFCYLGQFEYQSHIGSHPGLFTLARSGSVPSLAQIQAEQDQKAAFNPTTVRDGREWVLASIVRRRGQAAFRSSLLAAYGSACPITGCQVEPLLEAAHIIPYLGPTTNHIQNGLPLRADIHTLFDLQLLAISPDALIIELSPALASSEYAVLYGKLLALPANPIHHPSRDALRAHRIRCQF